MRDTRVTNSELDIMYETRGTVDCDRVTEPESWRESQRRWTRTAMERRAAIDFKKQESI